MKQATNIERGQLSGNAAAEYALVGVLICLVSVGALLSFSGAFSARVSDIKNDVLSRADQASQQNAIRAAQSGLNGAGGSGSSGAFGNGSTNGNGTTATTGANGNTLGQQAGQGGASSASDNNLTPAQEKLVTTIANNAHEVAKLQAMLKQLARFSRGNLQTFKTTTIVYKGNVLTAQKIANMLGENGAMSARLETLVDQLAASGADTDVLSDVSSLTDEVTTDAALSSDVTKDALTNTGSTAAVDQNTNPQTTHQDAATICGTTGGTDTGTSCGG